VTADEAFNRIREIAMDIVDNDDFDPDELIRCCQVVKEDDATQP
jgi:hypothetical protein